MAARRVGAVTPPSLMPILPQWVSEQASVWNLSSSVISPFLYRLGMASFILQKARRWSICSPFHFLPRSGCDTVSSVEGKTVFQFFDIILKNSSYR